MTGQNFTACHLARALSQAQTHSLSRCIPFNFGVGSMQREVFFRMIWSSVRSFTVMNFNIIQIKCTYLRSCGIIIICGREGEGTGGVESSNSRKLLIQGHFISDLTDMKYDKTCCPSHSSVLKTQGSQRQSHKKKKCCSSILLLPPAGYIAPAGVWGFWMGASICSELLGNRLTLLMELVVALWRLPLSCDTWCGYGPFFFTAL